MKRVVADTGPVLHLHEARALHLFPSIGEILVPEMVATELRSFSATLPPKWAATRTLSLSSKGRADEWQRAGLLHGGEAEALALAIELKSDWFLSDDAAARLMAESFGIEVHGSIGIVLWAAVNKIVGEQEAKSVLADLENSSLWMSRKVRSEARLALDRVFKSSTP